MNLVFLMKKKKWNVIEGRRRKKAASIQNLISIVLSLVFFYCLLVRVWKNKRKEKWENDTNQISLLVIELILKKRKNSANVTPLFFFLMFIATMSLYRYYIYNKSIDLNSDLKQYVREINIKVRSCPNNIIIIICLQLIFTNLKHLKL